MIICVPFKPLAAIYYFVPSLVKLPGSPTTRFRVLADQRCGAIFALLNLSCMLLMLQQSVNYIFIGSMIFSLVVILASIRWIRDLYRVKRKQSSARL
jgi:hypothetical protein